MDEPTTIYEMVDATDDETYYVLGLYLDLEEAIRDASTGDDPPTDCEDLAIIEIRERALGFTGWGNTGKLAATIRWTQYLHQDTDEWKWHRPIVKRVLLAIPTFLHPDIPKQAIDMPTP